ncbi:MAG: hypothetical protein ABI200_02880, partial [Gaiellales bacterium]
CSSDPPEIKDVTKCLKDLKLNVEDAPGDDKDVREGVFASTDVTAAGADPTKLTIALAALAKNDKAVKEFEKESKNFSKELAKSDGEKVEIESGTDGNYVWVVMGDKKDKTYAKAKDCVSS